ncbi:hypothetical protein HYU15_02650 [Candidatus Woesearchaeota archaeon]|nr:hypothetical protein [Candidatus Woesearchaeota archaeon]
MTTIPVPIKIVDDDTWLILNNLSGKGLLRAVSINKRKNPVADWDGHHCDEALAQGSVRYSPRGWKFKQGLL